ncbi:MAG: site-specific integrase [Oleiphilus sp.]
MVYKVKNNEQVRRIKKRYDARVSKYNYEFDVYEDVWKLSADYSLNFRLLDNLTLTPKFEDNFRLAFADHVSEFSAGYVENIFVNIRHLFATGVTDKIKEEHIINYKATLDKKTEYKLGAICAFILGWYDKDIDGVDKTVVDLLTSLTLSGCEKGKAVATGCPYSGAYSFDEQIAFIDWYVNAFSSKLISLTQYAFIMGLQNTGARPIQLRYLYHEDILTEDDGNITCYRLNVPDAKKRKALFRESFNAKDDIGEDLFLVLKAQSESSISKAERHFNLKLSESQKKTIPIFLNENELVKLPTFEQFQQVQTTTPDLLCLTKAQARNLVSVVARLCPLKTFRIRVNGEYGDLHINARRFRYTHATNMALLGASPYAIAEDLGHSDIQHVTVYTEFNEEIADRIDEALSPSLIPMAQAFSGTLIDSEKDAIRVNDPRSRIHNSDGNPVGNCGKFGFCANGTIHCYTCNKFQPWLNAPHTEVLKSIVTERDRKREMGASEFVLQGQNRSIDAIGVVIQKCKSRKQELEKESAVNA